MPWLLHFWLESATRCLAFPSLNLTAVCVRTEGLLFSYYSKWLTISMHLNYSGTATATYGEDREREREWRRLCPKTPLVLFSPRFTYLAASCFFRHCVSPASKKPPTNVNGNEYGLRVWWSEDEASPQESEIMRQSPSEQMKNRDDAVYLTSSSWPSSGASSIFCL